MADDDGGGAAGTRRREWRSILALCLVVLSACGREDDDYGEVPGALEQAVAPVVCSMPPAGIVSWWAADGDARDVTGRNHGTHVGAVSSEPGQVGPAFDLAGGHVSVANGVSLDFGTLAFSIEAWVRFDPPLTIGVLFQKEIAFDRGTYLLEFNDAATSGIGRDALRLLVIDANDVDNRNDFSVPVPIVPGTWHHVAATRAGSTNSIFFDGELVDSQSAGSNVNTGVGGTAAIGRKPSVDVRAFHGAIDEMTIYDRPLGALEVRTIFQARSAGKCRYRLPFASGRRISTGPGCPDHVDSRGFNRTEAIDYAMPVGTDVLATESGIVRFAGHRDNYGGAIQVEHANGDVSVYAHLRRRFVDSDDIVTKGQAIGDSGGAAGEPGAGRSTGPHLHFEIRRGVAPVGPDIRLFRRGRWRACNSALSCLQSLRGIPNTRLTGFDGNPGCSAVNDGRRDNGFAEPPP